MLASWARLAAARTTGPRIYTPEKYLAETRYALLLPQQPAEAPRPREEPLGSWGVPIAHALGLMAVMRVSAAVIWPEPFARTDPERWADNYAYAFSHAPRWEGDQRAFEWDGDRWWINVVGHGLFGSELYLRARQCQQPPLAALAFTAATSAVWEYAFEANEVQPSALDLWFTPLAGIALGELRHGLWQAAGGLPSGWRSVLRAVLDPLGGLERAAGTGC